MDFLLSEPSVSLLSGRSSTLAALTSHVLTSWNDACSFEWSICNMSDDKTVHEVRTNSTFHSMGDSNSICQPLLLTKLPRFKPWKRFIICSISHCLVPSCLWWPSYLPASRKYCSDALICSTRSWLGLGMRAFARPAPSSA